MVKMCGLDCMCIFCELKLDMGVLALRIILRDHKRCWTVDNGVLQIFVSWKTME